MRDIVYLANKEELEKLENYLIEKRKCVINGLYDKIINEISNKYKIDCSMLKLDRYDIRNCNISFLWPFEVDSDIAEKIYNDILLIIEKEEFIYNNRYYNNKMSFFISIVGLEKKH